MTSCVTWVYSIIYSSHPSAESLHFHHIYATGPVSVGGCLAVRLYGGRAACLLAMHSSRAGRGRPRRGRSRSRNHGNRRRDALPCHPPAQPTNPRPSSALTAPRDYRLADDDVYLYIRGDVTFTFSCYCKSCLLQVIWLKYARTRRTTFISI